VLAASVAVATSIAFSIDTTLRIGAACYLLVTAPAMLLMSAGADPARPLSDPCIRASPRLFRISGGAATR
jgi:hypothetical protein